jgi:hypothetical protein
MALKVKNFGEALKGKTFTCAGEKMYITSPGNDAFWIDSDGKYNTQKRKKTNVIYVEMDWLGHKITFNIVVRGNGKNAWTSHSAPINIDVVKTPDTFLHYIGLCIGRSQIWSDYHKILNSI